MVIEDYHRAAIRSLVESLGGAGRLAEKCGLSRPTAYHIASDKCRVIQHYNWNKLEPFLRPFLDKQTQVAPASDGSIQTAIQSELLKLSHEQQEKVYRYCIELQVMSRK